MLCLVGSLMELFPTECLLNEVTASIQLTLTLACQAYGTMAICELTWLTLTLTAGAVRKASLACRLYFE